MFRRTRPRPARPRRRFRRVRDDQGLATFETLALAALGLTLALIARGYLMSAVTSQGKCIKSSVSSHTTPRC